MQLMAEIIKTIQTNKKIYKVIERASVTLALSLSLIFSNYLTLLLSFILKIILKNFEFNHKVLKDSTDIINRKLKIFQLRYKVLKTLADILNRKKKERIKKCQSIVMIKRMVEYLHRKG